MSKSNHPFVIYKATNLINGKCYIGKTIQEFRIRKTRHFQDIKNSSDNAYFHNAIKKYGKKNFTWEVIFECDDVLILNVMETMKIIVNHSHWTEGKGYNLTWGGEGSYGFKHTDKSKKKMSEKLKGKNNPMYGKKHTEFTKRCISIKNSGRVLSDESKDKIASISKKRFHYVFISPDGIRHTPVNIRRFCRENELDIFCIKHVCAGRNKTHRGWYVEKWRDEENKNP
jgi:group I intron endonuclease